MLRDRPSLVPEASMRMTMFLVADVAPRNQRVEIGLYGSKGSLLSGIHCKER